MFLIQIICCHFRRFAAPVLLCFLELWLMVTLPWCFMYSDELMILCTDNIPTHFQEVTPLKKKLDEFGTFLAKVNHGFFNTLWVVFPKSRGNISWKFMSERIGGNIYWIESLVQSSHWKLTKIESSFLCSRASVAWYIHLMFCGNITTPS